MAAQAACMKPSPFRTFSLLVVAAAAAGCASRAAAPTPPGFTLDRTGDVHDFDRFMGAWSFENRRLKARNTGSNDWDEFPAISCFTRFLDGVANVDEIQFPTKGWSGLTVRTFDTARRQWSIYWINSRTGTMFPPVVGGFSDKRGEFYGHDTDDGKPVHVRYVWTIIDDDHLHWAQSFSYDGHTWETNWTNTLTRLSPTRCVNGRVTPAP
jgi:hypothetical protein